MKLGSKRIKAGLAVASSIALVMGVSVIAAPAQAAEPAPVAAAPVAAAQLEVNVPDIGGDEVAVTEILVKVGDTVDADQSLLTVEGDKASMEVPAPFAGVVKEIKVALGDKVSTGSLIMVFEVAGAAPAAAPVAAASAPVAAAPAVAAAAVSADASVRSAASASRHCCFRWAHALPPGKTFTASHQPSGAR